MHRSNPGRVALSSSLALLLGAGVPLQQISAQELSADSAAAKGARPSLGNSQGFQMVPGPAARDVLPKRTPETPGANGFELLPPSADATGAQASAAVDRSPGLTTDASGFQMLPASATAMAVSAPPPLDLQHPGVAAQPVSAGLPLVKADPVPGATFQSGFEVLPASSVPVRSYAAAPQPPAPASAPVVTAVAATAAAPSERIAVLPPFMMNLRENPPLAAAQTLAVVRDTRPAFELTPVSAPEAPAVTAEAMLTTTDGSVAVARPVLEPVKATAPDAELILTLAPEAPAAAAPRAQGSGSARHPGPWL